MSVLARCHHTPTVPSLETASAQRVINGTLYRHPCRCHGPKAVTDEHAWPAQQQKDRASCLCPTSLAPCNSPGRFFVAGCHCCTSTASTGFHMCTSRLQACLPRRCYYKLHLGSVWSEVLHTGKSQGHFDVADFHKCLQTHSTVTGFLCSKFTEYALDK